MRILIVGLIVTSATAVVVADIVSRDFHQEESNQDRGYSKDNDRRYGNVEDNRRQTRLELPDEVTGSSRTEYRGDDRRLESRRVQSRCGTQRTLSYTFFCFWYEVLVEINNSKYTTLRFLYKNTLYRLSLSTFSNVFLILSLNL